MTIDTPMPEEIKEEEYYNPQVYFKEVIDLESRRRENDARGKPMPSSKRLSEEMRGILKKRSEDPEDESLDRFIARRYPRQTKSDNIATLKELILSTSNAADDMEVVVDMALDEEGRVIDSEVARVYLDSKKAEVSARIEKLRQQTRETEGRVEARKVELRQWDKILELASEHLANDTKAEIESGKAVMRKLIVLRKRAEEEVKGNRESAKREGEKDEELKTLEKEMERIERVRENI